MFKILNELKHVKEQLDESKQHVNAKPHKEPPSHNSKPKEPNGESGGNTTVNSQQNSRPRTSRGTRPSSKSGRSSDLNGVGGTAIGFHSNLQSNQPLYSKIDSKKRPHNKSINEMLDSPRNKNSNGAKERLSPNVFAYSNKRQPSAVVKHSHTHGKPGEDDNHKENAVKNRPLSAKLKKKNAKSAERIKNTSSQRIKAVDSSNAILNYSTHHFHKFSNDFVNSQSLIESRVTKETDSSFDRNAAIRFKQFSYFGPRKSDSKAQLPYNKSLISKKAGSKISIIKRADQKSNKKLASYNQASLKDQGYAYNNISVDASMYKKSVFSIDKKRAKAAQQIKPKHRRSATPSLIQPQQVPSHQLASVLGQKNFSKFTNF